MLASGFSSAAKMAQENLIKASSNPYTIIRATQFFEFVKAIAGLFHGRRQSALAFRTHSAYGGGRCRQRGGPGCDGRAGEWHG